MLRKHGFGGRSAFNFTSWHQLKAWVPHRRIRARYSDFGYLLVWGYIADLSMVLRLRRGRLAGRALSPPLSCAVKTKRKTEAPALCVSGNFQGKQRVFGAPFWKLASFPESESWSGAKSDAKLRKSARYPGGRRVFSRFTRGFPGIPAKYPVVCRFG